MLIITENCNLKCRYCYEHDKTKNDMTFETAKEIIDKEFGNQSEYTKGEIELFGGEAFLNFKLIKQIYDYVMNNFPNVDFIFTNTTNGTLICGEIQKWLYERRNKFFCTLSLDGTPEMHDMNRPYANNKGSFDSIDLDFFRNTWNNCGVKMTVSNDTIDNLSDGVKFISSKGFDCMATFASGIDWSIKCKKDKIAEEFSKLVDYYTENQDMKLCHMLNYDLRYIFYPINKDFKYCGAGIIKKCYDIHGKGYPCQGLSPLSIGEDAKNFEGQNFEGFELSDSNKCKKCKWVRLCRTCYAANYLETGNIEQNCEDMCYLNRVSILACSKIQFNRLLQKDAELTENDRLTLHAIQIIQEEILLL
ncbi:MAG: 4Fe-4S cluster-binding domain-containing protein [Eubacteriales bacterium]